MSDSQPTPEKVLSMMNAYQQTAALYAAIELDVFGALGKGCNDVPSISRHCGASERGIRILCDFLSSHGLIEKSNGRYNHTPTSLVFLDPGSPMSMGSLAAFLNDSAVNNVYRNLAEVVRTGRTTLPGTGTIEPENPLWVTFAKSMVPMMGPIAVPLSNLVLGELSGPIRVLDVAAGHGLFGIEIAKQNPSAQITALDWNQVLDVASENARIAGVDDRYTRLPGSAFDVEFGGLYDAVLLTNFLHHFDKPTCVTLLKKVHRALRPGGIVATLEFVPDESRTRPLAATGFAMTMLTSTEAGDAYTLAELSAMYQEAGFGTVAAHPIPMSPQTVILGKA
ncbi:methyltransferase [Acidicapsa ligni]|uniref:methyltransferase n=1 Tax=Acidicapsa ligni TaxID=542300 RepID=UPI0021E06636|nr:class I SAM-dependent methyltransferase [Acidicapsa ligni]